MVNKKFFSLMMILNFTSFQVVCMDNTQEFQKNKEAMYKIFTDQGIKTGIGIGGTAHAAISKKYTSSNDSKKIKSLSFVPTRDEFRKLLCANNELVTIYDEVIVYVLDEQNPIDQPSQALSNIDENSRNHLAVQVVDQSSWNCCCGKK